MTIFKPLVVIVTPVYNGSPWLERTMACVQRQTYENIIHVLLDNASTDDTAEVISRYLNQKVPVKASRNTEVLRQTANWNAAFRLTPPEAKYVMLLCADDLIRDDAIEKLVARAEEDDGIVLVTAPDVVMDEVRAPVPPKGKMIVEGRDFICAVLDHSYNHFAWQLFFMRWKPEYGESDFFSHTATALDFERLLRVMETGKLGFVMEPLFFTRHHSMNMSAQFNANRKPNFRLFRWEAAIKYARNYLSPQKARKCLREEKYFVLRIELNWRMAKAHDEANTLKARLTADGFAPNPIDYLLAVAAYPAYKARQAKIRAAANARWPHKITEDDFTKYKPISSSQSGPVEQDGLHSQPRIMSAG